MNGFYMHDQMWQWLDDFPAQLRKAAELGQSWDLTGIQGPENVAFLGIGGSAIGATLVCGLYQDRFGCPVVVVRGEKPPAWMGRGSLAVATSYSGETRETLTAFREALDKGSQGLGISSGGTLEQMAQKHGFPHLRIPGGIVPRAALGYTSIPLIYVLLRTGIISAEEPQIDPAVRLIESLRVEWGDTNGTGAGVARRLIGRLPLIIGAGMTAGIAQRFQAQLAENAKAISVVLEAPEALHNLVETIDVRFIETFDPIAVYLEDPDGPQGHRLLLKQVRMAFQDAGIEGIVITSQGSSDLTRLYGLIHKVDWISYHLAKLRGIDPVAIPVITAIKEGGFAK